jgi:hypothetical protein
VDEVFDEVVDAIGRGVDAVGIGIIVIGVIISSVRYVTHVRRRRPLPIASIALGWAGPSCSD